MFEGIRAYNGRVFRLDLKSGQWEDRGVATTAKGETVRGYGLPVDKDNNLYLMEFGSTKIGKLDAKTNVAEIWSTPMARSRPRRGRFDDHNDLWFAEYGANRIAMFDPATEKIKEWKLPTDWGAPYDVVPTKDGTQAYGFMTKLSYVDGHVFSMSPADADPSLRQQGK